MSPNRNPHEKSSTPQTESEGKLEKIANAIDPASTQVSDEEIMDPGANTRDFPPRQPESRNRPSKPR